MGNHRVCNYIVPYIVLMCPWLLWRDWDCFPKAPTRRLYPARVPHAFSSRSFSKSLKHDRNFSASASNPRWLCGGGFSGPEVVVRDL